MLIKAKIKGRKYTLKRCSKCGYFLIVEDYNRDTQRANGLQRYCRACSNGYGRDDYEVNKDTYYDRNNKRAELIKALPNTLTALEYAKTLEYFNYRCALTGEIKNVSQEHFIAVVTGHAGTTAANIIPLRQDLNASKHAVEPFYWFELAEDDHGLDVDKWNEILGYLAHMNGLSIEEYVEFVKWCYRNQRTAEQVEADPRSSVDIWKEDKIAHGIYSNTSR
jgi:hypothetical protein